MRSKNVLARKILCGLLAAGVLGVSGSAFAAAGAAINATDSSDDISIKGSYDIGINNGRGITTNYVGENISIDTTPGDAWGNGNSGVMVWGNSSNVSQINLGEAGKTKKIFINVVENTETTGYPTGLYAYNDHDTNKSHNFTDFGGKIIVNAEDLEIRVHSDNGEVYAICAQNSTTPGVNNNPDNKSTIIINADNTKIVATSGVKNGASGIVAISEGVISINSNLEVHADNAITTRGDSQININTDGKHTTKLFGDINFNYDEATSGTKVDADLNVNLSGADSVWNGNAVVEWGLKDNSTSSYEQLKSDGKLNVKTFDLTIADGAQWNPTTIQATNDGKDGVANIALNNVTLDNGVINLDSANFKGESTIQIENIAGTGTVSTNSVNNKLEITKTKADGSKITVNGTSNITDAIASGQADLQQLANVVVASGDDKSIASSVTTDANDIIGGYSAEVKNGEVVSVQTIENSTNRAISDMASISLMTWRQENNDMNKRLGELRDSKGEHGAWARMARGESKYGAQNVKNQYNYYQVGYDEKLSVNPNWTVGVALTRTEGSSTFATGSGENKHTGFAVYGSYLKDDGSFIDLIAKYARMDNDYKTIGVGVGNADYETNGYSLSAEYGKRFTKDNGLWIEPQVELTYGKVGSANYTTSKGNKVYQDGMDSLVARLGFSLGKDIKQGNVYVRASYLYDFDGETTATMTGAGSAKFEQDLGGGWWEVGVGTNLNLSDATHLYFDVEKTYGGNVATPWQWNAGVRWSF